MLPLLSRCTGDYTGPLEHGTRSQLRSLVTPVCMYAPGWVAVLGVRMIDSAGGANGMSDSAGGTGSVSVVGRGMGWVAVLVGGLVAVLGECDWWQCWRVDEICGNGGKKDKWQCWGMGWVAVLGGWMASLAVVVVGIGFDGSTGCQDQWHLLVVSVHSVPPGKACCLLAPFVPCVSTDTY